ncbi:MAG: LytTR family DNA-binding domain-containing protein [Spirosomataceae bacterium]
MNCLIVDDEYMARLLLEEYVRKVPSLRLSGSCESALDAFHLLKTQSVDVVFLDIQMPHLTGLALVQALSDKPAVIFTTAYAEHAVEGFRLDAVDYLLKPFSFERFLQAVNKAADQIAFRRQPVGSNQEVSSPDHFFVKSDGRLVKIRFSDIIYIEGLKEYVSIYTSDKQRVITLQSLKNLEGVLPQEQFIRIHKSYVIALDQLTAIVGNQVQIHQKYLPIGATYKDELLQRLKLN